MKYVIDEIRAFFGTYPTVGLILPDGWFGRPYDNVLGFIAADNIDGELHIEFSGGEKLRISGDPHVEHLESSLAITGFTFMEWTWRFYGSNKQEHRVYSKGKVEFPVQPFLKR